MKIAVIEDEKVHRQLLTAYLERWGAQVQTALELYHFDDAESFWFQYEEQSDFDLLFLDIQMPGMSGMELAKRVREKDRDIVIVFATAVTDYLEEGYEVEALHYLVKPIKEEKVYSCLEKAFQRRKPDRYVTLHTEDEVLKISEEAINYVEARGHGCAVGRRQDGGVPLMVRESFSELEKLFAEGEFVKCHRSYLCRVGNIHHIGKTDIFFDDGCSVPVSRRLYQQVNQRFIAYFRR